MLILHRLGYALLVMLAVNCFTFFLFFCVNTPNDIARVHLGAKYATTQAIESWKMVHGYDLPLFFNDKNEGVLKITETLLYQKSLKGFGFAFGQSDSGEEIWPQIKERMIPSLMLAVPIFILGLLLNITMGLLLAFFRGSYVDIWGNVLCIMMMSISAIFYIIGGQYLISNVLHLVPVSGFEGGLHAIKFLILPVIVAIISGIGANVRWYRSLFLEELVKDYVRTARAKGLGEIYILFKHVLPNALLPILTSVVVIIPSLFMGSLILESFFAIPGLGNYTIQALRDQDFATLRSMVFLGTVLYLMGLWLTDIAYMWADPRVRFSGSEVKC